MTVPFQQIPQNWRLPLFFAEIDPSQANTATVDQRTLIIAQKTAAGSGVANIAQICTSQGTADAKAGPDSMLSRAYAKYRLNDSTGEVWILPVSDAGGAVAATGSVKFDTVATAAGVYTNYIAGQVVGMPVSGAQTLDELATAFAAAINAIPTIPVTATVDGADATKVDLAAVNAGLFGNDLTIIENFGGSQNGEFMPADLTTTIVAMAGGLTNPDFTTALANLVDMPFDFVVFPYTDTTSLNAMQSFFDFQTGRWSFNRQIYGHFMTALRGTVGALTTAGSARNDPNGSIIGFNGIPNPVDEVAAAFFGAIAGALRDDPGRPVQFLNVAGLLAPPLADQFADVERNTLLYDGISTFTVNAAGQITTENIITTYQLNTEGQPDNSYLEIETMYLLAFVLRDLRAFVTTNYPRMKLAPDGTRFAPGAAIITPSIAKFGLVTEYRNLEFQGYVTNSDAFAAAVLTEINAQNPNRLDAFWPGTLIGQLRMFALLAQFRLQ